MFSIVVAILVLISLLMILRAWNKHRKGIRLSRFEKLGIIITIIAGIIGAIAGVIYIIDYMQPISWITISAETLLKILLLSMTPIIVFVAIRLKRWKEIEYVGEVQATIFFPKGSPLEHINLDYHQEHLFHRLIINFKTKPATAYFMTVPNSYGWKFTKKYNTWVREIVSLENYSVDDPDFTREWCKKKEYTLRPFDASEQDLLKTD